jgi:hypothetical protein
MKTSGKMKIEGKILMPHVYSLLFDTQYELCMSFVRIQEFYESPKFRGKYFTLEEYMDYWSKEFGNGAFTYPTVWNGFNVPGKVLVNWSELFSCYDDERKREVDIFAAVGRLMRQEGFCPPDMGQMLDYMNKIYVIGIHKQSDNIGTLKHEMAHAMYSLYPRYRKTCNVLLKDVDEKTYGAGKEWLLRKGYCKKIIDDELQAYFSTSVAFYNGKDAVMNGRKEFESNFESFRREISDKKS